MSTMKISRRTILRGAGAAMALPLLDAMAPAASAAADKAPVRMAFVFCANGAIMPRWQPKAEGAKYELTETLKKHQGHHRGRERQTLLQGLARAAVDVGEHARDAAQSTRQDNRRQRYIIHQMGRRPVRNPEGRAQG